MTKKYEKTQNTLDRSKKKWNNNQAGPLLLIPSYRVDNDFKKIKEVNLIHHRLKRRRMGVWSAGKRDFIPQEGVLNEKDFVC